MVGVEGGNMVNIWNSLAGETVDAPSVNAFKNRIDKWLREYMRCTDLSFFFAGR